MTSKPAPLPGRKWRDTHQATVDSILGPNVRRVVSRGARFYNMDNWTARGFGDDLCEWARLNPEKTPTKSDVEAWLAHANRPVVSPEGKIINIAATPDELPVWLAHALVGGGYHEAWHTEFSRTRPLQLREVWPRVGDLWALVPWEPPSIEHPKAPPKRGWSVLVGPLLAWSNIVEDIRIERCGNKKYPGAYEKMEALQDLILQQEEQGALDASHRGIKVNDMLSTVLGAFRDLGLGYSSPLQKRAFMGYAERCSEGLAFVNEGPLKPFLDRAIALGPEDDLESLWLSMEILGEVQKLASSEVPPTPSKEEGVGGEVSQTAPGSGSPEQGAPALGKPKQKEAGEDEEKEEDPDPVLPAPSEDKPLLWKVGKRAVLKSGPNKGKFVEVTRAGLPDPVTGVQDLEFALVDEEEARASFPNFWGDDFWKRFEGLGPKSWTIKVRKRKAPKKD